ncbi:MAG: hypothetical protein ACLQVL_02655 [Terriglobia bacterium]
MNKAEMTEVNFSARCGYVRCLWGRQSVHTENTEMLCLLDIEGFATRRVRRATPKQSEWGTVGPIASSRVAGLLVRQRT